ncbi:MAG: hypothetical protein KDK25_14335, partial [Leptospiraceae bacterium]|nr:hypothetical protein [Leptospiraceae bacterium]
ADHQIAHVYVKDSQILPEVRSCLQDLAGIEYVMDGRDLRSARFKDRDRATRKANSGPAKAATSASGRGRSQLQSTGEARAGDLVAVAEKGAWFHYYYWLDDSRAPDFARTVDIHRKPGYDPVELFVDPELSLVPLRIGWKLLKKALGFRMLMDVIPLRPDLVKGSHGRLHEPSRGPLLIAPQHYDGPLPHSVTGVFSLLQSYFRHP